VQHSATLCNTVQHCATLCNAVQRCATLCNTLQLYATLCNTVQRCATLCNTVQRCAPQWNSVQRCATLYRDKCTQPDFFLDCLRHQGLSNAMQNCDAESALYASYTGACSPGKSHPRVGASETRLAGIFSSAAAPPRYSLLSAGDAGIMPPAVVSNGE
jgi:hypothetical protein